MDTLNIRRGLLCCALVIVSSLSAASALPIDVGGRSIELPAPAAGYELVTPDMGPAYETQSAGVVPSNVQFAMFIPADVAAKARRGELPFVERFMRVQSTKALLPYDIAPDDYARQAKHVAAAAQQTFANVADKVKPTLERQSEVVSKLQGADVDLSIDSIKARESEFPSDRITLIPAQMVVTDSVNGESYERVVSMTSALVLVKGKLLFLYVYGGQDDLAWTKQTAREWSDQVIAANPGDMPSTIPSQSRGIDWGRVIGSAIAFGLLSLVVSLFRRKKASPA